MGQYAGNRAALAEVLDLDIHPQPDKAVLDLLQVTAMHMAPSGVGVGQVHRNIYLGAGDD